MLMSARIRTAMVAVLAAVCSAWLAPAGFAAEAATDVPMDWRGFAVLRPPVFDKGGKVLSLKELVEAGVVVWRKSPLEQPMTPAPPTDWTRPDFDDASWGLGAGWILRCREEDLKNNRKREHYYRQRYGSGQPADLAVLCGRGRFEVKDPAAVKTLTLSVEYRGGIVVALNGKEIARSHLPQGKLTPDTPAQAYPLAAHVDAKGESIDFSRGRPLVSGRPSGKHEQRVRKLECRLPLDALRRGANVLAIQVHRAPLVEQLAKGQGWGTAGIVALNLRSPEAAAFGPVKAATESRAWNASVIEGLTERSRRPAYRDLLPVRIVATRNGTFSGQIAIDCAGGPQVREATMSAFTKEGGGGTIPPSAVRVRYALPRRLGGKVNDRFRHSIVRRSQTPGHFEILSDVPFESLADSPQKSARPLTLQPVWVTVKVPANAVPGDYRGDLTVTLEGGEVTHVPVELNVGAFSLPDPSEYVSHVGIIQSPESLAVSYDVPLYSEKNWALTAESWKLLAEIGNKVVYVPVICKTHFGNEQGMVRWVRKRDGSFAHDFSRMDRYLDTVLRSGARPTVVCLYAWDLYCYAGGDAAKRSKVIRRSSPPLVSVVEEQTGKVTEMKAPAYNDPAAAAFWKPVADGFLASAKKHGLEKAVMVGIAGDLQPAKDGAVKVWSQLLPGACWVRHSHTGDGHAKGYATFVYRVRYPQDPGIMRAYGWRPKYQWRSKVPLTLAANVHRGWLGGGANHPHARVMNEMVVTGGARGLGRARGDLWDIVERFLMNNYRQLSLNMGNGKELLQPGETGPAATISFEMFREGIEETEARIVIEKALVNKDQRARLGEALAAKAQKVLDERLRYVLWTGASGHGNSWGEGVIWKAGSPDSGKLSRKFPRGSGSVLWGGLGWAWYDASGWQGRSEKLFEAAAEVAARMEKK